MRSAFVAGRAIAAALAAGLIMVAGCSGGGSSGNSAGNSTGGKSSGAPPGTTQRLPVAQIEQILRMQGKVDNGVLTIDQDRDDLHVTDADAGKPIPFGPAWEDHGEIYFQPGGANRALLNANLAVLPSEADRVIDKLEAGGLVFQAFHQHVMDLTPMVFFIHFRGVGDPLQLARATAAAIAVTGTPLPQQLPAHPTTPLPAGQLGKILGGDPEVAGDGVVLVDVPRRDNLELGGVGASSSAGLGTEVAFEPLPNGQTAVMPDFGMTASEVDPVMRAMRAAGFTVGCLYNQETDENPQLYFSHQLAIGDALQLAQKVRQGLNHMNMAPAGG
jgi:hypothetical protein